MKQKELIVTNTSLPGVQEVIKPTFETLSEDDLLDCCLKKANQNQNESLNSLVSGLCPKDSISGLSSVKIACTLAAACFNDGATSFNFNINILSVSSLHFYFYLGFAFGAFHYITLPLLILFLTFIFIYDNLRFFIALYFEVNPLVQTMTKLKKNSKQWEKRTHTLALKCIGAAHEKPRQESLKIAARVLREKKLEARLRPEPNKWKNKDVFAFDINYSNGYFHADNKASEFT